MIGGVVLAAGGASRFGSPKQLAELDGRPLLQHAVDAMLAVPAIDPVVVVLGAEAQHVREAVDFGEARVVVCGDWAEGMAASLRCGVDAVGDCDWVILTLGDQPRVTPQVIAAVMDRADSAPAGTVAVRATYDGAPGHPVALGRAMLPRVAQLSGDAGARDLLGGADVRTFEAARLCDPADVDTPEELEALRT
ncbi:MAG TPA: nucleotidyltransferase family protein [Solirubrobacteraceae bacterium]